MMGVQTPILLTREQYQKIRDQITEEVGEKGLISSYLRREYGFSFRNNYYNPPLCRLTLRYKDVAVDFWDESAKILFILKFQTNDNIVKDDA